LAGESAYVLFALGLIGTGMLGVPVLAGSAAYAVTEALHWRGSLNDRPKRAPKFYGVLAAALLFGLTLNYLRFSAVKMLFWAAVLNGILAPPLVGLVTILSSDKKVMGDRTNTVLVSGLGWLTTLVMSVAAVVMGVLWWAGR
jgi:Mn2+/Fe2+ NRAMP family transporter